MAEKVYTPEEIEAKLKEMDGWYLEEGWLRKKYNTDGWPTTLMLVNTIGYLCEAAYHHADLAVTWGKLWVQRCTSSRFPSASSKSPSARLSSCVSTPAGRPLRA